MLPIIDIVYGAINNNKDLSSLRIVGDKGLSSLNGIVTAGLPKLTLSQNLFERGIQCITRCNSSYKTEHVKNKELIEKVLGGDAYHAAKVKGCIKNTLKNLSDSEFTRLKKRCDKIRSPRVLLGVFTEIMHEQRMVPLLKSQQLETLLSSWSDLKSIIDKGMQAFKKFLQENRTIKLKEKALSIEEQLFVIQTLYDRISENNITSEKWSNMDENKKTRFFLIISEGAINSCLNKKSNFESALFGENPNEEIIEQVKDSIFQAVKEDLYCLEYSSLAAKQTN